MNKKNDWDNVTEADVVERLIEKDTLEKMVIAVKAIKQKR